MHIVNSWLREMHISHQIPQSIQDMKKWGLGTGLVSKEVVTCE